MFHKGTLESYDSVKQMGIIHLSDKNIQLYFFRKDFPNLTLEPQIGERVKCLIEEMEKKSVAKFIVRLDYKNARVEQPYNDLLYSEETESTGGKKAQFVKHHQPLEKNRLQENFLDKLLDLIAEHSLHKKINIKHALDEFELNGIELKKAQLDEAKLERVELTEDALKEAESHIITSDVNQIGSKSGVKTLELFSQSKLTDLSENKLANINPQGNTKIQFKKVILSDTKSNNINLQKEFESFSLKCKHLISQTAILSKLVKSFRVNVNESKTSDLIYAYDEFESKEIVQSEHVKHTEIALDSFQDLKHQLYFKQPTVVFKQSDTFGGISTKNQLKHEFYNVYKAESKLEKIRTHLNYKMQKQKRKQKQTQIKENRLNPWALMVIFSVFLFMSFAYLGFQQYFQHKKEQQEKSRYYLLEQQKAIEEQRSRMGKLSDTPIIPEKARKELLGNELD